MFRAEVSLVGDILIHDWLATRAKLESGTYSFARNFEEVQAVIHRADVASANLESLTAGNQYGISGFPKFNAPVELLGDLREAGFSVLSVANNHMLDMGEKALMDSLTNIEAAGLSSTGASRSKDAVDAGVVVDAADVRIGFISFTDGAKIKRSLIEDSAINYFFGEHEDVRMVRRLNQVRKGVERLRQNADCVVLQLHFGEEYHRYPSAFQREFVASLCETGVDVIVGHHPHVLQPMEWVENSRGKEVLVMYSLGNFLSGQLGLHRQMGAILSFSVLKKEGRVSGRSPVIDPQLTLTLVDPSKDFSVRLLSQVVAENPSIHFQGVGALDSAEVYRKAINHSRTYIPDLAVS